MSDLIGSQLISIVLKRNQSFLLIKKKSGEKSVNGRVKVNEIICFWSQSSECVCAIEKT